MVAAAIGTMDNRGAVRVEGWCEYRGDMRISWLQKLPRDPDAFERAAPFADLRLGAS
jgi:hypothetical protein